MTREFLLPDLGEGLVEATIVSWKVAVGDEVAVDQLIVEVESAKSVVELPVPFSGTITKLGGAEGDTLQAGQMLVTVGDAGDAGDGDDGEDAGETGDAGAVGDAQAPAGDDETAQLDEPVAGAAVDAGSGAVLVGYGTSDAEARLRRPDGGRFKRKRPAAEAAPSAPLPGASTGLDLDEQRNSPVMSPLVRREAQAAGFDARHLRGSGPNGLVLRDDVRAAVALLAAGSPDAGASAGASAAPSAAADQRIPLTGMRAVTAKHMAASHAEVPRATIWLDVDLTDLIATRRSLQDLTGERFSLTTLVARVAVAGLRLYPRLNSSFDGDAIIEHGRINLGLAAQTPRGLAVPVVPGTERMTLRELRDAIQEVVDASREGKFPPERLRGGTFTLNNYGGFGVDGASPIINQPEAAMLGIGRIKERPWAHRGEVALRQIATFSFVFDHRVCDGEEASSFLTFVTDRLEHPELLFADL